MAKTDVVLEREATETAAEKDAVETAIEIAKNDRVSTWEEAFKRAPNRVARWSEPGETEKVARGRGNARAT